MLYNDVKEKKGSIEEPGTTETQFVHPLSDVRDFPDGGSPDCPEGFTVVGREKETGLHSCHQPSFFPGLEQVFS